MKHTAKTRNLTGLSTTLRAVASAVLLGLISITANAQTLGLADRPLFTGETVDPNILVAVDDSGSMDFETLFTTNNGLLYWDIGDSSPLRGGQYIQDGDEAITYAYLFPNGANNCSRFGCASRDRRVYSDNAGYYALPPIPALGFARSPQFNKSYFNPDVKYTPWITDDYGDVDVDSAPADPAVGSSRFDLDDVIRVSANGYNFVATDGMSFGNVTYRARGQCVEQGWFGCNEYEYEWITSPPDYVFDRNAFVGIEYYPATFYLKSGTELPPDFGWDPDAETVPGRSPDGTQNLVRYEIKRTNFDSASKYQAAMQNFANWFSYYRKRHLATRAGITSAFDEIQGARVGICTISQANSDNPPDLTMRDLDATDNSGDESDRNQFYNRIFGIDFHEVRGTPNRAGLKHLGQQLETNASIITSPCQRNYAILFTDGYNSGQISGVGNVDGVKEDEDEDTDPPFGDNYKNTIADVAMKYYENLGTLQNRQQENFVARNQLNLPAACSDTPPDPWLDCQKDLHMVTFGVTLGQQGTIFGNTDEYPDENNNPYENAPEWPDPNQGDLGDPEQIDDLWHATINSRGKLLNARTPVEVADAFAAALERITAQTGSASAVSANTGSFSTESVVYQGSFTGGSWSGRLKAYSLADPIRSDTDPLWDAGEKLTHTKQPRDRVILTSTPSGGRNNLAYSAAVFRESALPDGIGLTSTVVDYLRGDRSEEGANGGDLRNRRDNILGDIVNSSPTFVGAPDRVRYPTQWVDLRNDSASLPENNAADYSNPGSSNTFAQSYANRTPMVYVGANDGMLHGFSAETGEELLAYVPGAVLPGLSDLADPNYIHRYYVDGSPNVGDVVFDGGWHTVLVSGLGNGGNSVFALDVTDPSVFSESNADDTVLWEFTDDNLGQTFGKPSIVRLHHGGWGAMFTSGYSSGQTPTSRDPDDDDEDDEDGEDDEDDEDDEGNTGSQSGGLYFVDIETGDLIERVETENGRGLSEPFPVDLDGDFITDYAYAGDLDGNVWKFDLTAADPSQWTASLLFTAESSDAPQPITTQPQVGVHPYGKNYGVMVYFGTGKYLEPEDAAVDTSVQNSFYGIWDLDVFSFNEANNGEPLFSTSLTSDIPRGRLTQQTVITEVDANGKRYRVLSNNDVPYQTTAADTDGKRGWVIDGFDPGELIVSKPRLEFGTLSFSTRIPSVQSCTALGSGYFMLVDAGTGGRTEFPAFDLNDDNQYTQTDDTIDVDGEKASASGVAVQGGAPGEGLFLVNRDEGDDRVLVANSNATITQIDVNVGRPPDGRRSWREIRR